MADKRFLDSYNKIGPSPEAAERIWERLMAEAEGFSPETEVTMRPRSHKKIIRTVLIAAAITALFAVGAYAADFLGMKALFIEGSQEYVQKAVHGDDGTVHWQDNPDGGAISLSQPQEVTDTLDASIQAKIEAAKTAWEEWEAWRQINKPKEPEALNGPEDTNFSEFVENDDGTVTANYYKYPEDTTDMDFDEMRENAILLESRTVTAEEYRQYREYWDMIGKGGIDGYDFNYGIYNQEMAAGLENIAAKYDLELRREQTLMFPKEFGFTGENAYTTEEMLAMLKENVCTGDLFNQSPTEFDKAYFFQEGSFALSYYGSQPSTGEKMYIYLYNSMYATLSSGREIMCLEEDVSAFTARTFQAQDGTELTILSNGQSAYIYAYLENSFLAAHVQGDGGITDADVDAIANAINYSSIGK